MDRADVTDRRGVDRTAAIWDAPVKKLGSRFAALVNHLVASILIGVVRLYQWTLRPFLGGRCRFEPSCSRYFILAVQKHGPWRGAMKGIWRVCRCQPFCSGGYDPP